MIQSLDIYYVKAVKLKLPYYNKLIEFNGITLLNGKSLEKHLFN